MPTQKDSVPVVYIRGGTSKAIFFHEHDVPPPGAKRDQFLRRIMGSPDPLQIDGMGGSHIVTSKIALIKPSDQPDIDVDYTFVQVGINDGTVGYSGNCGNISAGVGPFAIDQGLVKKARPGATLDPMLKTQEVRIYNTGTKKILISHVPVDPASGKSLESGTFSIAGCPGTGAPILMDYSNVVGGALNMGALPTNNFADTLLIDGLNIDITVCDVANIIVFALARDLGVEGNEKPADLDKDTSLIARVKELRGKAAQKVGMCKDWKLVDEQSPMLPMVALVSLPTDSNCHIQSRLFLDNKCHTSMAGTGAICTAACSRIPGSIVNKLITQENLHKTTLEIQHPLGHIPAVVKTNLGTSQQTPEFQTLSFIRTARQILDGKIRIPDDVKGCFEESETTVKSNGVQAHDDATKVLSVDNSLPIINSVSCKRVDTSTTLTTKTFAQFVADLKHDELTLEVKQKLRLLLLDYIGVSAAATKLGESSTPFLNGIKTLNGGGNTTVIANGQTWSAPFAALLNGALAHTLDFDDTHAGGALHPGVSVISATLAEAETNSGASTADLLTALAAGYEVTCRLGVALGTGGYSLGFHNTSTAGIFGAVAAIAKLRSADAAVVENAFGLALSKVSGTTQYLANGSWNKRLHPGFAAHDAFTCVSLAQAGVVGAAESIEGKYGFLNVYSNSRSPRSARPFLEHWEFLSTAIKPYPACRMTHGQIELASQISSERLGSTVTSIVISLAKACYPIVGEARENKIQPKNIVDAQFSSYYQTAVAWIYGEKLGWKVYDYMNDEEVRALSKKISIEVDDEYVGLESSLKVEWEDGTKREEHLKYPTGEADNPMTWDGAVAKFMSLASEVYGEEKADRICKAVKDLEAGGVSGFMSLVK